jgi:short-subunit dehydrogenase
MDILVNDAAVQSYGLFEELPWEHITRTFDVTCFGYMRFARAVLPHFRSQGSGHIINVLSMLSKGGAPLLSIYTAAKHALLGWQKSLKLVWRHGAWCGAPSGQAARACRCSSRAG